METQFLAGQFFAGLVLLGDLLHMVRLSQRCPGSVLIFRCQ